MVSGCSVVSSSIVVIGCFTKKAVVFLLQTHTHTHTHTYTYHSVAYPYFVDVGKSSSHVRGDVVGIQLFQQRLLVVEVAKLQKSSDKYNCML